jgi:peroxiredoxin
MRNIILVFCFLGLFVSCQRNDRIIIKGQISNPKHRYIYLAENNLANSRLIDSSELSGTGWFNFKIKPKEPEFYYLFFSPKHFITILAQPGENIIVHANEFSFPVFYALQGSEGSAQVKFLNDKLMATKNIIDSLRKELKEKQNIPGFDSLSQKLNLQYQAVLKDQRLFSIKFIIEHLNSLASILALYQEIEDDVYVLNQNRDIQYIKLVSDTLKKYYPKSKYVLSLWKDRERLLKKINLLKIQSLNLQPQSYPEIALPSVNGDTIKLSSIKNKFILLYFWSFQDEESIFLLNNLKKIYKDYHTKGFEIYNVSLDNDFALWKKFINDNKLPGIQVIENKGTNSYYAHIYNINQLPTSYLIDRNNNIVGKNMYGNNLADKLDEISH